MLGFSYFVIYLLMFLVFHFPSTQESIPYVLVVIVFGGGIAVWYLCVVFQNGFNVFHKEEAVKKQDSMWSVGLFLLGYTSAFTLIAVKSLSNTYFKEMNTKTFPSQLSLQFLLVGLLALVPTIHILTEPLHTPFPLTTTFSQLMLINLFDYTLYTLHPLERIRIV
ncbi:unnamed protein product [Penicillium salamii]|nr:unnamed protein product [Penicillium salamii]